ncbi:MAG: tetraacyldisaccharide 4'-kinase, partial [Bacteroidota bacterium]|nr:tetraacyldisaccharide 4'-kinase [Bacteroidota bacterium]
HVYTQVDVSHWLVWMKDAGISSLVTTEKDAVRLRRFEHALEDVDVWVLPLTLVWHTEARVQAFLETWTQTLPSQSKPPQ